MTGKTQAPTVARWVLARELRRLRGDRSATQVAKALRSQPSSLARWESGGPDGQVPGVARLEKLMEVYEAAPEEAARLLSLRETARTPGWWQGREIGKPYGTFIGLEAAASDICAYEAQIIPGLLQIEDYTHAVTRACSAPGRAPADEIANRIAIRMRRQEEWIARRTPHLWAIVTEGALRSLVGGSDVMRAQLQHVLELSEEQDMLTLQVLPFTAGAHAAMEILAFALIDVPDAGLSTVYLEGPTADIFMDDPQDVTTYRRSFEHLRKAALNSPDSRALITEIVEGLSA
ncbi:helix-turn-helix domain-containing protein [Nocardiopsis alborubida]|uniref:Helix-turn-helix domain-containing protein n=1 Tax=Nocardiopsis alborubida TaxID=146802 RepID=A0A7X6MDQ4_9ACTN|nr:helix-turn-helix transcriptional regulator [Nocardiopsis alborubida]NKY99631.1 helix-turn-helix domain-containing protein [Nocardiopsis alborubida]